MCWKNCSQVLIFQESAGLDIAQSQLVILSYMIHSNWFQVKLCTGNHLIKISELHTLWGELLPACLPSPAAWSEDGNKVFPVPLQWLNTGVTRVFWSVISPSSQSQCPVSLSWIPEEILTLSTLQARLMWLCGAAPVLSTTGGGRRGRKLLSAGHSQCQW